MNVVLDDQFLKVSVVENQSDKAVLCFTGVGYALGGIDVQSEEFFRVSSSATTIFIIDKMRSWGNYIDFENLSKLIEPYIIEKSLFTIGNSMGGFLSILASKFFNIKASIAFVPQFTVSKNILPDENRWDTYVININKWKHESLKDAFNSETVYYAFFGLNEEEKKQIDLFPSQENVGLVIFEPSQFAHNVASVLKEQGILYEVIQDCLSLKPVDQIIQSKFQIDSRLAYRRR